VEVMVEHQVVNDVAVKVNKQKVSIHEQEEKNQKK